MQCRVSKRLFSRHLDGELGPWRRRRLVEHLAVCAACRTELEAMEQVWALLGEAPGVEPPEIVGALLARLEGEPRVLPVPVGRIDRRWFGQLAHAAAVLLVAGAGAGGGLFAAGLWQAANGTASESDYVDLLGEMPIETALVSATFDTGGGR
jgi:anti-sigma factor RsiW